MTPAEAFAAWHARCCKACDERCSHRDYERDAWLAAWSQAQRAQREVKGFVIRHPGEIGETTYVYGDDPLKLHSKYFEGFNPVYELREVDMAALRTQEPR